jgi:hypothetical protein
MKQDEMKTIQHYVLLKLLYKCWTETLCKLISWGSISYEWIMRGFMSIIQTKLRDIQKGGGGWLVTMISTDNGDNLLQRQIHYIGKIIGNKRGRCNEGWLYIFGLFPDHTSRRAMLSTDNSCWEMRVHVLYIGYIICLAISSHNFQVKTLFYRMLVWILKICICKGFWFSLIFKKITGCWT